MKYAPDALLIWLEYTSQAFLAVDLGPSEWSRRALIFLPQRSHCAGAGILPTPV